MLFQRKSARTATALLLGLALAMPVVTAPPAGAQILSGAEDALGAQANPEVLAQYGGAYDDPTLQAFVDRVGRRLTAQTDRAGPWRFTVLNSGVVNAFALPGGYVHVTRGLLALARDEAEVAAVLGHEIGHVLAHHTARRLARQSIADLIAAGIGLALDNPEFGELAGLGGNAWVARYTRGQESEADRIGVELLERAGYDPFAEATVLTTIDRDNQYERLLAGKSAVPDADEAGFDFFADHPQTGTRIEDAAALARRLPPGGVRPVDPYLSAVDGMIFGDSPETGFVRGRDFAHPALGIAFTVPEGFTLLNGASQVIARGPDGAAIVFDSRPVENVTDPTAYLTGVWGKHAGLRRLETFTVNGMPAATGVAGATTDAGPVDVRLVVIRAGSGPAGPAFHRFTFIAPGGVIGRFDAAFRRSAGSFHLLSPAEAASYRPLHLRVVTANAGDTVEGFVRRMPPQPRAEELFRIINDLPPGTPIRPGRPIKLITE